MSDKSSIETPMTQYTNRGAQPTGNVTTDGKASTIPGLPTRTISPAALREVTFDHNGDLPLGAISKGN